MSAVAVAVLLSLGVGSVLFSCLGVLVMREPLDRLHFTAPANTLAPAFFAAAVLVEEPLSGAAFKAVLTGAIVVLTAPVLTHATARAARVRSEGRFRARPDELARREQP